MKGRLSSLLTCVLGVVILGNVLGYYLTTLDLTNSPMLDVTTEGPVDTEPVLDDNVTPDPVTEIRFTIEHLEGDLTGRYHLRKRTARFFKRVRVV